jgi:hypothetical protein
MLPKNLKSLASIAIVALAGASASAQLAAPAFFKINQPWRQPLASHASVVENCGGAQVPFGPIAMDDFLCTKNGPLVRMQWWGTMDNPNLPPQRRFFIRFWSHAGTANCRPTQSLWQGCVDATFTTVGVDCQNRRVLLWSANLPQPYFNQIAGTRYWVQISEVDRGTAAGQVVSPRPGVIDWRWSAHRDIKNCPALQIAPSGAITQPILDPCDQQPDDLAFRIYSRGITGTLTPGTYTLRLFYPGTRVVADTIPFRTDDEGNFDAYPEVPDGTYDLLLEGMASTGLLLPAVQIADGSVRELGQVTLNQGDANNDGRVNFSDITAVLGNFGAIAP